MDMAGKHIFCSAIKFKRRKKKTVNLFKENNLLLQIKR